MIFQVQLSAADKKEAERKRQQFISNITRESPKEKERRAQEHKIEKAKKEKEKYEALPESDPARQRWEVNIHARGATGRIGVVHPLGWRADMVHAPGLLWFLCGLQRQQERKRLKQKTPKMKRMR